MDESARQGRAKAGAFPLSDQASFITGAELTVDSGRTVAPVGLL
ncbi:hypothetical protein [Sphingomonas sp. Leaf11]|nr:hypothetical protein [Sphingomonas sp. Leaf11]